MVVIVVVIVVVTVLFDAVEADGRLSRSRTRAPTS